MPESARWNHSSGTNEDTGSHDVITWRLTQIEKGQERTAVAIEDFRRELALLATKADLAKVEERVNALETRQNRTDEKVGATWIKVSAIGGGLLAVAGTVVQVYLGGK